MSLYRLIVFLTVVQYGSFNKAAKALHLSQPSISKQIKELEDTYKVRLFDRVGGHLSLTHAGDLMIGHAKRIVEDFQSLSFEMNQLSGNFTGTLHLGASTTISQYVIAPLLSHYIKAFPEVKLDLISGNTLDIEQKLKDRQIDIALVEGNENDVALHYEHFLDDEIVLITRPDSVFGNNDEISLSKLTALPLVMREFGSGSLSVIEKALSEKHLKLTDLRIILQLGSTESIKDFLSESDALAMVSIRSVMKELKAGTLKIIDIENLEILRAFRFATLLGEHHPIAEHFIEFAKTHFQKL